MPNVPPFREHLVNSASLETQVPAYQAGFISLALEKTRRATPFVDEAKKLKVIASNALNPADLLEMPEIRGALLTAAGVSNKARGHLEERDKTEAIKGMIDQYLEPAGSDFVDELVYRFLLTRGDALGGSMRNVGGELAQRKLTRSIISTLNLAGVRYWWMDKKRKRWAAGASSVDDADIEFNLSGLAWESNSGDRTLIYSLTVPDVENNVDICLFSSNYEKYSKEKEEVVTKTELYIALGELKGGIDPAGADEHWKTARTALERIREGFAKKGYTPATFFIGAAIETKMAKEIWSLLLQGTITNAANLTDENQVSSITRWLCQL